MQLTTDRLLLRPIIFDDWQRIYEFSRHPDVQRFEGDLLPNPQQFADIVRWLDERNRVHDRTDYYLAITRKADSELIGSIKLVVDADKRWQAELGYWLARPLWGQGLTTEACQVLVRFGFETLKLHRIYAVEVVTENVGSVRVLEKLGFRREGHYRESTYLHGERRWCDTYSYAILDYEWRAAHSRQNTGPTR